MCVECRGRLDGLSDYIKRFEGMFVVLTPPHPQGCNCEWCNAVAVAKRKKQEKWTPLPPRDKDADVRQEPPNEKPLMKVTHIDEARQKQEALAKSRHPSGVAAISVSGSISNVTLNGQPIEFTDPEAVIQEVTEKAAAYTSGNPTDYSAKPAGAQHFICNGQMLTYDEVVSHAHEFKRHPERPKPKTSGCYLCGEPVLGDSMCDVCQYMLDDYIEWRDQHPAVDI